MGLGGTMGGTAGGGGIPGATVMAGAGVIGVIDGVPMCPIGGWAGP